MPRRKQIAVVDGTVGDSSSEGRGRHTLSPEATARRNELIEQYQGFVEIVVTRLIRSMGLPLALKDDFTSAAFLGLIEAAGRFDASRGLDFRSYAHLRIRGSVVDHIRSSCELSGHEYRKFRALEAVQEMRESELLDKETKKTSGAEPLARSRKALHTLEKGAIAMKLASVSHEQDKDDRQDDTNPEEVLEKKQEFQKIRSIVATLPEKERTIIEQYYFHDRKLVDVAAEFAGLSKSWVSRLHERALEMLREKLSEAVTDIAA